MWPRSRSRSRLLVISKTLLPLRDPVRQKVFLSDARQSFYESRPDKNRPYCAVYVLASGPEVAENEVSGSAGGSAECWIVQIY